MCYYVFLRYYLNKIQRLTFFGTFSLLCTFPHHEVGNNSCFGIDNNAYKKDVDKRLRALLMRASGKKLAEIATATGYSFSGIVKLVSKYRDGGLAAIVGNHYGSNRRNMSCEEESALLEPFRKKAEVGQIVEVSEIKAAYQEAVGHSIGTAQIYYVLHRHRWRKIMPRSKHPKKASKEVIEASKKLTRESRN